MPRAIAQAVRAAAAGAVVLPFGGSGLDSEAKVLASRPYINNQGHPCITVNTGQLDKDGMPIYAEQRVHTNATLRKDEWVKLDEVLIEAARERLVIVEDLRAAGLTYNVGGLGVIISEWEKSSEITDAEITIDGESDTDNDRQEFGLNGVPIPVIQKRFKIGERMLMASRSRGAALDVTTGVEAARAVARTSEKMVFNGTTFGTVVSDGNTYQIHGLTTFPARATLAIADWALGGTTPETILANILSMIQLLETQERQYGPFTLYIPGGVAHRFREDFKANSDKTLMQRVLEIQAIKAVRVSDVLNIKHVVMVALDRGTIDLAVASDLSNIQWGSPSGWTNYFQTFAAWAPRLKEDFDGRTGILHATMP
jgi:uncharacterized linocin/CFP29 family protein